MLPVVLMLSAAAHAGIIIGNIVPGSTVILLEADTAISPGQIVEGVKLISCDGASSWQRRLSTPASVTDFLAVVAPDDDWCTARYDLGPSVTPVSLSASGDFLVGTFSTPATDWDVTFGDAAALGL